jgi:hypothetical protein
VADVLQVLVKQSRLIRNPVQEHSACPTLLIIRGDLPNAQHLRLLLDQFASATGLQINYFKSMAVSIHMDEETISTCILVLGAEGKGSLKHTLDFHYQIPNYAFLPLHLALLSVINI